jgi:hypothetical protein
VSGYRFCEHHDGCDLDRHLRAICLAVNSQHDDDLHARPQLRRPRRAKPASGNPSPPPAGKLASANSCRRAALRAMRSGKSKRRRKQNREYL